MIHVATVAFAAAFLAAAPAVQVTLDDKASPGLAGSWVRAAEASDDLDALVTEAVAASRGAPGASFGRSGGSGTRSGRLGAPGRQGLPPGVSPGERFAERFAHLARGLEVLVLDVLAGDGDGPQILIRDGNRETRVLLTDGRVVADGLGSQTIARFEGEVLVIETRSDAGGRTERVELDADGERLAVTTDLDGGFAGRAGNLTFRSVYERVERSDRVRAEAAEASSRAPTERARLRFGSEGAVIRILPPAVFPGQLLTGKVLVQTLTIDPAIEIVELLLDGETVERRTLPPFEARVPLADPPREQVVEVVAYAASGRRLGEDRLLLNRLDPPFRVRIAAFEAAGSAGAMRVRAEVSVPRNAALESVALFRNDDLVAEVAGADLPASPGGEVVADLPAGGAGSQDYVRVAARLRDGRELEDVELLQGADFSEEVDVHLVQLQVLAVDGGGRPVSGLEKADFSVREDGAARAIDRVYPSRDVSLVLGLAIDSSGSMGPLWEATRAAAERFLEGTLAERDRAFLVDFDTQLRLLQGVTGDRQALYRALDRLQPQGGTALYDSILYSLLQYQGEPGRRALIVLTDGFDSASRADPKRAIEMGERLGVPVYVIAMRAPRGPGAVPPRGGFGPGGRGGGFSAEAAARNNLRLITDPTGGRLFQVATTEQVENAFAQIQDELRSQYVLTYYSERRPEEGIAPVVGVARRGMKVKTALPLDLAN
ncbi:MAG TPA: VWA domain-containing protein [Thermoanaerobaculia bacterium]|nr:VWA domain-containing protein [Thermoanaerobaculia bacterium]